MALQSVQEAFSQDFFRAPPQRLGYGLPRFLLVPLLSSAPSSSFTRLQSPAPEDLSALGSPLSEKETRTETLPALQTSIIPWFDFGVAGHLCNFRESDYPAENTKQPPFLPGTRVGHPGFGFDKRAEERTAVPNCVIPQEGCAGV